jgi:hypothetical protein
MANKTIADRLAEAQGTGKEAKFYSTDATSSGTEYEFTPAGIASYVDADRGYVLAQSAVAVPLTGSTAETVMATVTIPAGVMGANDSIRIRALWSYPNSADDKIVRVRLNGISGTAYHGQTLTTSASYLTVVQIYNRGVTNSQVGQSLTNSGSGSSTNAVVTSSIDMTAAVSLVLTGQLETAAETLTLEAYTVELVKA